MTSVIDSKNLVNYDKNGFFIISSFLNKLEISQLLSKINKIKIAKEGFYTSTCIEDSEYRNHCNNTIKEFVTEKKIHQFIEGYSIFYTNFINKTPDSVSEVVLHTDWSITDETIHQPFKIWIPLVDVNKDNGTFSLVRGSHKFTNKHRGFGANEYYTAYSKDIIDNCLTYLNFPAGQALFYHPGMLHYSPSNTSEKDRPAILISLYPTNTQPILYYKNWYNILNSMSVYKFDANFMNVWDKQSKPKSLEYIRTIREKNIAISKNKFIEYLSH